MKRIAIIGGGISGLAAAFSLEESRRAGAQLEYVLFESSRRLGGVLQTELVDGCLVEAGPDSFLTEKRWAGDLCRQLDLGDQLIGSNDAIRKTYILIKDRLIPMPYGLAFMVPTRIRSIVSSPLFSMGTKWRMAREWFTAPQNRPDESVASLVARHYGAEMVERLADPLLSGVYGGDASLLSVRAVLPRFAEMESKFGSLSKATLAARKKTAPATEPPKPLFTSLKNGMQQLLDALVARLNPISLRLHAPVQSVQCKAEGWRVTTEKHSDVFDAVILATPAHTTAELLQAESAALASELCAIPYSSSVTVALGYDQYVRAALPPGFGFLVPRGEGKRLLAATFVHNKFPFRAPDDRALLRCFLGGVRDGLVLELTDEEILRMVQSDLRQILGIAVEPHFTRVYRWKNAMAQYVVGHLERLERIEALRRHLPGLALAGNYTRGIGIPDCIRSGQEAASAAMNT